MGETPEQLAQGRSAYGIRVGDRVLDGTAVASENTTLQVDSSGNVDARTSITLSEITDPGAASAGMVVLFAEDSGGSTRLVARFPSGQRQQIAIEQ